MSAPPNVVARFLVRRACETPEKDEETRRGIQAALTVIEQNAGLVQQYWLVGHPISRNIPDELRGAVEAIAGILDRESLQPEVAQPPPPPPPNDPIWHVPEGTSSPGTAGSNTSGQGLVVTSDGKPVDSSASTG